jgi:hypothetical protein
MSLSCNTFWSKKKRRKIKSRCRQKRQKSRTKKGSRKTVKEKKRNSELLAWF